MSPEQEKRDFVAAMYPSDKWRKKVANMSDAQVFAIFKRAQEKAQQPKPVKPDQDDIPF
jgi:hypothetical protein